MACTTLRHAKCRAHVSVVKLVTVLTCPSCRLFLTAVLLILRRAGSSICSRSAATALTARDLSTSMLGLRLAAAVIVLAGVAVWWVAADPPAAIAVMPCDGPLLVLLAASARE